MGLNISLQINFTGVLNSPGKELIMNLHNLPNVIGEQRKLLKAIADAEITSDDMLKLSELDPEFGKLSSIVATIYSKVSTTTDISLAEVTPNNEDQTIETTPTQREEWVPATKLRNMYPLAYSFIRNCVDLSASRKEEIWKVFRKAHSEYSISEDDFYRLMRLVINIRVEKAREIDEKVNSSLVAKKSEDNSATESKSLIDKPIIDDEPVDEQKKDKKTTTEPAETEQQSVPSAEVLSQQSEQPTPDDEHPSPSQTPPPLPIEKEEEPRPIEKEPEKTEPRQSKATPQPSIIDKWKSWLIEKTGPFLQEDE
jgi:hypothetical protein